MAFTTPPTFVDGAVLSAAQLNILAANQTYLSGLNTGVNLGFPEISIARESSQVFHVVHSYNNLYVSALIPDNDTRLEVYYDGDGTTGNEKVYDSGLDVAGQLTANVDISDFGGDGGGGGYVMGSQYEVTVSCRDRSGPAPAGTIKLHYIVESSAAL